MGRIIKFKDWENCVVIYDHQNQRWLLFRQPIDVHVAHSSDEVSTVLQKLEDQVESHQLYAAGFVSYEAAPAFDPVFKVKSPDDFPLAWFGIYSKPERISLPASTRLRTERLLWKPSISEDKYDSIIRRIREYLGSGDTYQVNYSFRLRSPFSGDPWALFVQIIEAQGSSYGAFVNIPDWSICSASPELFFRLSDRHLICRPMKGTATRGLWQAHDLEQSRWLKNSEKNRAENVMIVDMVRNDMGKIADAIDMDFVYGFVPRTSLNEMVRQQAKKIALQKMERLDHTMRLEMQELSAEEKEKVLQDMIDRILIDEPKYFWKK